MLTVTLVTELSPTQLSGTNNLLKKNKFIRTHSTKVADVVPAKVNASVKSEVPLSRPRTQEDLSFIDKGRELTLYRQGGTNLNVVDVCVIRSLDFTRHGNKSH